MSERQHINITNRVMTHYQNLHFLSQYLYSKRRLYM